MSGSKPSSSTNRLSLARPTRVSSLQAANTERSSKQVRSASTPKISSAASLAKSSASVLTVPSEPEGSGIQRLRSLPNLQKQCQQNKDGSTTKGSLCPKPRARLLSVPAGQTQVPVKAGGKHMLCVANLLLIWLIKSNVSLSACCLSSRFCPLLGRNKCSD